MGSQEGASLSMNACISCKSRKRKCDRIPSGCQTCLRVGRTCVYEDDPRQFPSSSGSQYTHSLAGRSPDDSLTQSNGSSSQGTSPGLFLTAPFQKIDPFLHESLRQPTVDVAIATEAAKILGSLEDVHVMAARYFESNYRRMPMISKVYFYERLQFVFAKPKADFLVLCLGVHLIIQFPTPPLLSMQSSLYVLVKNTISLLESTSFLSLEVVQARLLVSFYEMGHGIHPAASISIGACARTARALGLNKKQFQRRLGDHAARLRAEEEKRVWWAIVNLDRFINLCNGDALLASEDPLSTDILPIDDAMWAQNVLPESDDLIVSTPSDIRVGPFARECQVSHLIGRVLRHVYEPASDLEFCEREALQLDRTLNAFFPLLVLEEKTYGMYCAALGMCCNALFTLYDFSILHHQHEIEKNRILGMLEEASTAIVSFSAYLFGNPEKLNYATFSPFVSYSLYQAGVVQFRLWKQTSALRHRESLDSVKMVLGYFNKRWLIAGKYLENLEMMKIDWPVTMPMTQGFALGGLAGGNSDQYHR